ncbi:MAG: 16S rRNA (uracil(1498)-N(3))-methyltransferase [Parachlamydiales bacterium]|nr:16S rRNA (uracil(1498)-N(3))-methyltransferase [Parachlamydiales bacterium]
MPINRFFIDSELKKSQKIILKDSEFKHLRVFRKTENDLIEIVNGNGVIATGRILKILKNEAEIFIEKITTEKEKIKKIILIQAVLKPNNLDMLFEKTTELGVNEIWLFESKNSEKIKFSENRKNRIQNILISAMKQCGRLFLPRVKFFTKIDNIKSLSGLIFYGSTDNNAKKLPKFLNAPAENDIYMVIGPEKGFSEDEIDYLKKVLKAQEILLNENILRAETAGIISVGIISLLKD